MRKSGVILAGLLLFLAVSVSAQEQVHTLQRGETIYALAKKYGVKENEILFLNGIEDARRVSIGQKIRIPDKSIQVGPIPSDTPSFIEHKAVRGETLFGIARNYKVTVAQIQTMNNLGANYVLKIGDTLRIPVAGAPAAPSATPAPVVAKAQSAPAIPDGKTVDRSLLWPVTVKDAAYMTGKLSGVVLTGTQGESVRCIAEGTVVSAGPFRGFGRVAIVQTKDGYVYVYGGQESLAVKEGDRVASGAELGKLGLDSTTGKSDLFFMVYKSQNPIDPATAPRT
ncbi:MAG: LysM peptidoglycan-binding domain-containing M23 family metallopeptidase [Spirochaetaceae bacterium]|nr:LysM peptidoglycan-binding domain-containing M23 family metallopeptidase [Spirochaetaceae bacterium]